MILFKIQCLLKKYDIPINNPIKLLASELLVTSTGTSYLSSFIFNIRTLKSFLGKNLNKELISSVSNCYIKNPP